MINVEIPKRINKIVKNIWVYPKIIDPDFIHRKYLLKQIKVVSNTLEPNLNILDVGCGWMPYRDFFLAKCKNYIGIDIRELPGIDIKLIKNNKFPVKSDSIDICLSWQVLEHVENIPRFFNEIKRCLKGNGILYLTTHGFFRIHNPEDFWRWTDHGLVKLLELNGFSDIKVYASDNSISAAVSFLNNVFAILIPNKKGVNRIVFRILTSLLFLSTNCFGYFISILLDKIGVTKHKDNPSVYLVETKSDHSKCRHPKFP